jgi:hypothetical protein
MADNPFGLEAENEGIADAPKAKGADGEYLVPVVPSVESAVPVSVDALTVDPSARRAAGLDPEEGANDSGGNANQAPAAFTFGVDSEEAGDKDAEPLGVEADIEAREDAEAESDDENDSAL